MNVYFYGIIFLGIKCVLVGTRQSNRIEGIDWRMSIRLKNVDLNAKCRMKVIE